jgi:hypothetical protein
VGEYTVIKVDLVTLGVLAREKKTTNPAELKGVCGVDYLIVLPF